MLLALFGALEVAGVVIEVAGAAPEMAGMAIAPVRVNYNIFGVKYEI